MRTIILITLMSLQCAAANKFSYGDHVRLKGKYEFTNQEKFFKCDQVKAWAVQAFVSRYQQYGPDTVAYELRPANGSSMCPNGITQQESLLEKVR
jgi:hypothetical protein